MHNFESTLARTSATHPGVRFTIRCITEGVRLQLRRQLAGAFARIRDIEAERDEFYARLAETKGKPFDQITMAELTPRERREFDRLQEAIDLVQDTEVQPAYFDAAFVSVEGLTIDGRAPDGAALRDRGPSRLVQEITAAILAEAGLTPEQRANLESPSTSAAAVDGITNVTSAAPASATASTADATAGSISPAT